MKHTHTEFNRNIVRFLLYHTNPNRTPASESWNQLNRKFCFCFFVVVIVVVGGAAVVSAYSMHHIDNTHFVFLTWLAILTTLFTLQIYKFNGNWKYSDRIHIIAWKSMRLITVGRTKVTTNKSKTGQQFSRKRINQRNYYRNREWRQ